MGSGRRSSASSGSCRLSYYDYSAPSGTADSNALISSRRSVENYAASHVSTSYSMPFGLPPPLHRTHFTRDSTEFAWPAEPPSPHGPPRPYAPTSGSDEETAAIALAAAAGDTSVPDAEVTAAAAKSVAAAAPPSESEPPRGSLLFGLGGMAATVARTASDLAEHRALVEEEHLRLEYAMAALDAAGARTRRHWRRVSRLAEAEAWFEGEEETEEREGDVWRAGGERLTGLYRNCRWKLAGNEHEGQEPGRFRPVLQPVLANARFSLSSSGSTSLSARTMSMEDVGLQLARKCSRYIVDIVKTESQGNGLDDGTLGPNGAGIGGDRVGEDSEDSDDVWGVIGPLGSAGAGDDDADLSSAEGSSGAMALFRGASNTSAGDADLRRSSSGGGGIGIIEEVSSNGESPAARAQREEEERCLVEERVRQTVAAVAASSSTGGAGRRGGGAAVGPRVDLGPGAGRWRRAVAVAAEAASGMGVTQTVMLVTPKGNRRGRLSLVDKVSLLGLV